MIQAIITDIEGTTTPIEFVHEVLFPYSLDHLEDWIGRHPHDLHFNHLKKDHHLNDEAAIEQLKEWIKKDEKHPLLKEIQGKIWREGYQSKELMAIVYPDVPVCLKLWQASGIKLGVYSSGSVDAQTLLFTYSNFGDLHPLFTWNFDTGIGHKRESKSYQNILKNTDLSGDSILFLSDIEEELDAAAETGIKTCQLLRDTPLAGSRHLMATSFNEVTSMFLPFLALQSGN